MHFFSLRQPFRKQDSSAASKSEKDVGAAAGPSRPDDSAAASVTSDSTITESKLGEDPPCGLKELVAQPADDALCVDIVAIHGLNGHREKTWTDSTMRLNWLNDEQCLRKDIPNARILTFGYNSRTHFSHSRRTFEMCPPSCSPPSRPAGRVARSSRDQLYLYAIASVG